MSELRVYLDHLIERESFRYVRPVEDLPQILSSPTRKLTLKNLRDPERVKLLRKPDFQRATWAWSPDDCIELLDSVIKYQVVPSIIMWASPLSGLDYILDGGHRISVVLAWLHDDWGDSATNDLRATTPEEAAMMRESLERVRFLVTSKIGKIEEYRAAEQLLFQILQRRGHPDQELDPKTYERAMFYQNLLKDNIGFDIQYVVGNYEIAEESFLKINRSGRILSDWEKTLVQHRNSSFGRTVMAIANITSMDHYWPTIEGGTPTITAINESIRHIQSNIKAIHGTLLLPEYKPSIRTLEYPYLVALTRDLKPFYIAEFLTILSGKKGTEAESEKLLKVEQLFTYDANSSEEFITNNGVRLSDTAIDALKHLWNPFPHEPAPNQSLAIVAPLYFYSTNGRPVRGLLYGFLYWLLSGSDTIVRERKQVFSAYRGIFEDLLLEDKEQLIQRLSRNIGSGTEITLPVARYFQALLQLLVDHQGDTVSAAFQTDYHALLSGDTARKHTTPKVLKRRTFSQKQRNQILLSSLFGAAVRCEICGGILNPTGPIQHDHIQKVSHGGLTTTHNQRITHPFCNQNRDEIERIRQSLHPIVLPRILDSDQETQEYFQLPLGMDDSFLSSP